MLAVIVRDLDQVPASAAREAISQALGVQEIPGEQEVKAVRMATASSAITAGDRVLVRAVELQVLQVLTVAVMAASHRALPVWPAAARAPTILPIADMDPASLRERSVPTADVAPNV